jgi:DNA-3-methyladenine glycosylase I
LSWATILKKRAAYRKAFADFEPEQVARFSEDRLGELLQEPGIVRNRLKIKAAINNAQRFLEIQNEFGSFDQYIWRFVNGKPIVNSWKTLQEVPAASQESEALSQDLVKRGFKFVGSTIMYAHMQACGLVHDHLVDCWRYRLINEDEAR